MNDLASSTYVIGSHADEPTEFDVSGASEFGLFFDEPTLRSSRFTLVKVKSSVSAGR
jgi:hypothetical protein